MPTCREIQLDTCLPECCLRSAEGEGRPVEWAAVASLFGREFFTDFADLVGAQREFAGGDVPEPDLGFAQGERGGHGRLRLPLTNTQQVLIEALHQQHRRLVTDRPQSADYRRCTSL